MNPLVSRIYRQHLSRNERVVGGYKGKVNKTPFMIDGRRMEEVVVHEIEIFDYPTRHNRIKSVLANLIYSTTLFNPYTIFYFEDLKVQLPTHTLLEYCEKEILTETTSIGYTVSEGILSSQRVLYSSNQFSAKTLAYIEVYTKIIAWINYHDGEWLNVSNRNLIPRYTTKIIKYDSLNDVVENERFNGAFNSEILNYIFKENRLPGIIWWVLYNSASIDEKLLNPKCMTEEDIEEALLVDSYIDMNRVVGLKVRVADIMELQYISSQYTMEEICGYFIEFLNIMKENEALRKNFASFLVKLKFTSSGIIDGAINIQETLFAALESYILSCGKKNIVLKFNEKTILVCATKLGDLNILWYIGDKIMRILYLDKLIFNTFNNKKPIFIRVINENLNEKDMLLSMISISNIQKVEIYYEIIQWIKSLGIPKNNIITVEEEEIIWNRDVLSGYSNEIVEFRLEIDKYYDRFISRKEKIEFTDFFVTNICMEKYDLRVLFKNKQDIIVLQNIMTKNFINGNKEWKEIIKNTLDFFFNEISKIPKINISISKNGDYSLKNIQNKDLEVKIEENEIDLECNEEVRFSEYKVSSEKNSMDILEDRVEFKNGESKQILYVHSKIGYLGEFNEIHIQQLVDEGMQNYNYERNVFKSDFYKKIYSFTKQTFDVFVNRTRTKFIDNEKKFKTVFLGKKKKMIGILKRDYEEYLKKGIYIRKELIKIFLLDRLINNCSNNLQILSERRENILLHNEMFDELHSDGDCDCVSDCTDLEKQSLEILRTKKLNGISKVDRNSLYRKLEYYWNRICIIELCGLIFIQSVNFDEKFIRRTKPLRIYMKDISHKKKYETRGVIKDQNK